MINFHNPVWIRYMESTYATQRGFETRQSVSVLKLRTKDKGEAFFSVISSDPSEMADAILWPKGHPQSGASYKLRPRVYEDCETGMVEGIEYMVEECRIGHGPTVIEFDIFGYDDSDASQ